MGCDATVWRRGPLATRRHGDPSFATQRRVRIVQGFVATLIGMALATVRRMGPLNPKLDIVFKMLFAAHFWRS